MILVPLVRVLPLGSLARLKEEPASDSQTYWSSSLCLDWTTHLAQAKARVGGRVALQGNIDPSVLFGSEAVIRKTVRQVLDEYGADVGHVFNLGHGISQFTTPEAVGFLVDEVHRYSRSMRETKTA